jgi:uncharacterized membrane protein
MTLQQLRVHMGVVGAGYALGIAAALGLFGPYRTYPGQPLVMKIVVFLLLPLTATAILGLTRSLHRRRLPDQSNGSADAAIAGILLWIVIFLVGVHTVMVGVLVEAQWLQPWASRAVVVLLGCTVIAIGNLLPRTRPNMALGIRTSRTIVDRQLWILTHRVSGYLAVAVGTITAFAGLMLPASKVAPTSGIAFLASLVVLAVFYWRAAQDQATARQ